ncbi:MAG: YdcF family protein [Desulfobacterales bacterium]|jgi:uncharacterized SAM-binding protein YcdF (DUF218 family)|nr:YdcF family protein [Desulfobacterales bacterium]
MDTQSKLKRLKTLLYVILAICAFPIGWAAFLMGSVALYSYRVSDINADAAIVLGAAVARSVPTPVFEQRIRHAINLYHDKKVKKLVLTGGVGSGDTLAESEAARNYCLKQGVPENDMLLEVRSHSTLQNLLEAKPILQANGLETVLIVSDPLHMRRAITFAHDLGIEAYPSPTPTSRFKGFESRWRFLTRESYFYGRYLLLDRKNPLK